MQRIEGTKGGKRTCATWGSKKLGFFIASVAVVLLAAPGVASARSYAPTLPPTIAPVLAPTIDPGLVIPDVSWSDVSWSDSVV